MKNIVLYVCLRKLYRKLFICSSRELITEPSDLPNPLEWTTMSTAGGGGASGRGRVERNRKQKADSYQELPELVPVAIYLKI